jgi:hypothetical protein
LWYTRRRGEGVGQEKQKFSVSAGGQAGILKFRSTERIFLDFLPHGQQRILPRGPNFNISCLAPALVDNVAGITDFFPWLS